MDYIFFSLNSPEKPPSRSLILPDMREHESMQINVRSFKQFFAALPKTEIHLHLEGIASVDTVWSLMNKHKLQIAGITTKQDLQKRFYIKSLDEFISLFINIIQNCFKKAEDISFLIADAEEYLKRNNVRYAEIFFAPSKFVMNGIPFPALVEQLEQGAEEIKKRNAIEIRYIIDVSRSYGVENAIHNLDLTLKNRSPRIIGIGLGGSEASGPAKDYVSVFEKAVAGGLQVVAHAGEDVGPESIWDALKYLKASRIGHGISAIQDRKLMDYLAEKRIPLEICPTSNIFTRRYVKKLTDHPIRQFYDHGMLVTLNTDDPALFGVELIDEYMNLLKDSFFTPKELILLVKNNLLATFLSKEEKNFYWKTVEAYLQKEKAPT